MLSMTVPPTFRTTFLICTRIARQHALPWQLHRPFIVVRLFGVRQKEGYAEEEPAILGRDDSLRVGKQGCGENEQNG